MRKIFSSWVRAELLGIGNNVRQMIGKNSQCAGDIDLRVKIATLKLRIGWFKNFLLE